MTGCQFCYLWNAMIHARLVILDTGKSTSNLPIPRVVLHYVNIFWPTYHWGDNFPKIQQKLKVHSHKLYLAKGIHFTHIRFLKTQRHPKETYRFILIYIHEMILLLESKHRGTFKFKVIRNWRWRIRVQRNECSFPGPVLELPYCFLISCCDRASGENLCFRIVCCKTT